jgi:hypothetical protein
MATLRETKAFLALYWQGMDQGYMYGYKAGEEGLEAPKPQWAKLNPNYVSKETLRAVRTAIEQAAKETRTK